MQGWLRLPEHAQPILSPHTTKMSLGTYFDGTSGAAVANGNFDPAATAGYPVMYPANNSTVDSTEWEGGGEFGVFKECTGTYPDGERTVGAPAYLLLPSAINASSASFQDNGTALEYCLHRYQDEIAIIPKNPLERGKTYQVSITANGQTYTWSFSTKPPVKANGTPEEISQRVIAGINALRQKAGVTCNPIGLLANAALTKAAQEHSDDNPDNPTFNPYPGHDPFTGSDGSSIAAAHQKGRLPNQIRVYNRDL